MLSILIPIYNYNIKGFVEELHLQASSLGIEFEIIVFEDGSKSKLNKENKKINLLKNVTFKENRKNLGRSKNRNLLASTAKFPYLLFLDDGSIIPENFLVTYIEFIENTTEIIYGGRIHAEDYSKKNISLRWKYGKNNEDKSSAKRKLSPYRSLLFNNTIIKKELFNFIAFDENITEYGHEDTLFSYQIKEKKIKVEHIDNPVIHIDIDSNTEFLEKFSKGLHNLKKIYVAGYINADFVKILKTYEKLKKIKADAIFAIFYKLFKKNLKQNLTSSSPSLKIFNLYRLSYFCYIINK